MESSDRNKKQLCNSEKNCAISLDKSGFVEKRIY